jgi:hypothetical protein
MFQKTHNEEFKKLVAAARSTGTAASVDGPEASSPMSPPKSSCPPPDSDIILVDSEDDIEDS